VSALLIRAPGPQTTLQDLGRPRARRHGVPLGGAADAEAHRLALALAGAPADAATLEFRLAGPSVAAAGGAVRVALVGAAGRIARADGRVEALASLRSATLEDGDALAVGPSAGAAGYLALSPAPAVAPVLGARGTMLRAGFGGWEGRALRAGDRLPLEGPGPVGPERAAGWAPGAGPLRVIMGPQEGHFTAGARDAFLSAAFTATAETDRMGVRLAGPPLAHSALGADILSEGLAPGSVQVPGDGQPILLGVDAQTIGGYPKIATVISADLPRIGRLRPGDAVRFAAVTLDQARAAWAAAEAGLAAAIAAIRPAGGAPDAAALLGAELAGGAVDAARPDHFPHALTED
jgi:biotin-dependent carboxylase-like uncharacterized protein